METRKLDASELEIALSLAWQVFKQFEAPDYSEEGVEAFYKSIHDPNWQSTLQLYGSFHEGEPVGVIATRNAGSHIALFFVKEAFQRQGIGRSLFELVKRDKGSGTITVNSSPYAVPVYRRLGFFATDEEQSVSGIRFTPMKIEL